MQGRTNNTLDVRMGAMCRLVRLLCLATVGVGMANSSFALEFTADQITKIDGRTHKAFIYYRDQMWRIEHHSARSERLVARAAIEDFASFARQSRVGSLRGF